MSRNRASGMTGDRRSGGDAHNSLRNRRLSTITFWEKSLKVVVFMTEWYSVMSESGGLAAMNVFHKLLDIFCFVVALLALVNEFRRGQVGRRFTVLAVGLLLAALGGVVLFEYIDHQESVHKVQRRVVATLASGGSKTLDELVDGLGVEEPLLKEALDGISGNEVTSTLYTLSQSDGSVTHQVRLYYKAR